MDTWGHFPFISLTKPFSGQLSPVLCSLMPSVRKWTVSIWGFRYSSALVPCYCLSGYFLPSSVYSPGIGLFWNSYWHTWSVTAAFKVCCETVSTYIIWWQIPLAHEGSDIEVTTKIRSETFYYRWTQKTAVSSFEKESLQTFISSSWTNSYIACSYGPVLLHHFAHLVVTVSGEGCSSNKTRPWIGMVETTGRSSFTYEEYVKNWGV